MVSLMVHSVDLCERARAFAVIKVPMDEPLEKRSEDYGEEHPSGQSDSRRVAPIGYHTYRKYSASAGSEHECAGKDESQAVDTFLGHLHTPQVIEKFNSESLLSITNRGSLRSRALPTAA